MADPKLQLFEIKEMPGKGKGLVACTEILPGTRILCEKPLFIMPNMAKTELMESIIANKLKTLSSNKQRQFLSLHNNFPGRLPFSGTVKTNALPCGPDSMIGGVYPTICLINHDCVPNANNCWNSEKEFETIHATRHIKAGEEITISYVGNATSEARRTKMKDAFGFVCSCSICTLSLLELVRNDDRRLEIDRLDRAIGGPSRVMFKPEDCLADCHRYLGLLEDEYKGGAEAMKARVYYDAFQICSIQGDHPRASAFAALGYESRLLCEGEDSADTQKIKRLKEDPMKYAGFGASAKWKTAKKAAPKGLEGKAFEKWLWRQEK